LNFCAFKKSFGANVPAVDTEWATAVSTQHPKRVELS
jgi:hypothetical protein